MVVTRVGCHTANILFDRWRYGAGIYPGLADSRPNDAICKIWLLTAYISVFVANYHFTHDESNIFRHLYYCCSAIVMF